MAGAVRRQWTVTVALMLFAAGAPPADSPVPRSPTPAGVSASAGQRALALGALARLPLAFEPNTGQASAEVRYVSRGTRYRVALTPTEARFTAPVGLEGESAILRLRLTGNVLPSAPVAEDELPGRVHYFVGGDPAKWRRHVPTYRRVVYRGVYPRTDLVFHGSQREAEFDFVLAPGADPSDIHLELEGADGLALDGGDLVARAGAHELRLRKPVVYQEADGARVPIDGRFKMAGRRIAFEVGHYDRGRALVIDPVVTYSTYLGETGDEAGTAIGVDAAGNMYATVRGMGVVKLSADGATLLYSTVLGDASMDRLAVDGTGHAYLGGTWPQPRSGIETFYPTTPNALRPSPGRPCAQGDSDGVMAKLSPDGSQLLYSSFVGGNCAYHTTAVAIDPAGNFYVAGHGSTTGGFVPTRPPFGPSSGTPSPFPGWVQAVAADFSGYLYSVQFLAEEGAITEPTAIAADAAGNAYLVGRTGHGFPTTAGALQPAPGAGFDSAFVAKIAPGASRLVYGTYFGQSGTRINDVTVDAGGNAYLTGFAGAGLPTANALQPAPAGGTDAFVAKLDTAGSTLVFSTYLGGSADDAAIGIRLDASGNIYVAGPTDSTDFPQRSALPPQLGTAGSNFITALAPSGASMLYSTYFADAQSMVNGMAVAPNGIVHVTGATASTSFPTVRPYQPAFAGGSQFASDAFIARIEPGPSGGTMRVFITAPAEGATVSGTAWLTIWIENAAAGAKTYTLGEGSTTIGSTTTSSNGPVALAWPTTGGPNGSRTVTVSVRDGAGNTGTASRTLDVQNTGGGGGGTIGVFVTAPAPGAAVTGTAWLTIWIENAAAGAKTYTLGVDGTPVASTSTTSTGPVSLAWSTTAADRGSRTATVSVRDSAGNSGSASIELSVSN